MAIIIISGGYRNTYPNMPSRLSDLTDAVNAWFRIHGKVVFTFAVFNILLIVFCVVYWGVELPMYQSNTINPSATWFTEENKSLLHRTNIFESLYSDLSDIVFKFRFMFFWIFLFTAYMVYILREINQTLTRVSNVIRYEPEDLTSVIRGVNAMKRHIVEQCEGFEDLLRKIIRIMPEHPVDVRDAVYSFQDMTEDLLTKIKKEIRMLRIDSVNHDEMKEETVELTTSSAEASGTEDSELPTVPIITPKPKRGRKSNNSGSSYTSSCTAATRPLLSITRLGSRRANEMIQQATQ